MSGRYTHSAERMSHWFAQRASQWFRASIYCLVSIVAFWIFFVSFGNYFESMTSIILPIALVPPIVIFVAGMFWRGSLQSLLSLCGAASSYFGFYVYSRYLELQLAPTIITNKLGVGKLAMTSTIDSMGAFYFLMGVFTFILVLLITYRPMMFRAKGSTGAIPYPIWSKLKSSKSNVRSGTMLVPVQGLLDYSERHLSVKYLYLVILIGGKRYFVSPNDWVPQGSLVLRDANSGTMIGIPKVADGFNIW